MFARNKMFRFIVCHYERVDYYFKSKTIQGDDG